MQDIMTLEEVAKYLKVKPQTIYTWAQNKKIPAAKLGKEWRFKKSLIDEWFDKHIDEHETSSHYQNGPKRIDSNGPSCQNFCRGPNSD